MPPTTPRDSMQMREEIARLQKQVADLKVTLATVSAEKRAAEFARDVATRAACVQWPRR